jgi:ubiquinone/menaquinone biosynthesis C-methylase UbiE
VKTVEEWTAHWDAKVSIADPVELNGYCVDGKPIALEAYRRAVIEPWLERLELEPHHQVLDIGCGSGLMLTEMERRVARCVGIDPSRAMIERYKGAAETMVCAADRMPFGEASFDRVLMASVAHYFPSFDYFEAVMRRALELLRRDGLLLVADLPIGAPKPNSAYLFYDRHWLLDLLERLGQPYSLMAQSRLKRRINRRHDLVIYKD